MLICNTGWTWEYVDERMTLPRLEALVSYWKMAPPLAQVVAGFLGIKPEEPAKVSEITDKGDLSELVAAFTGAGLKFEMRKPDG